MPFLIIGGHAVNAYGISRQTGDIDLLVNRDSRQQWFDLFAKLRYKKGQEDPNFARFRADTIAEWPIDLMFVDAQTFDKLYKQSQQFEFGTASARVVSPRHLVALKLHALKQEQPHRAAKDYSDLLQLLQRPATGLTAEDLRALCSQYGTDQLFERLSRDLGSK